MDLSNRETASVILLALLLLLLIPFLTLGLYSENQITIVRIRGRGRTAVGCAVLRSEACQAESLISRRVYITLPRSLDRGPAHQPQRSVVLHHPIRRRIIDQHPSGVIYSKYI
nr:hypothetical protein pA58H3_p60 [Arthrobacter sp.]